MWWRASAAHPLRFAATTIQPRRLKLATIKVPQRFIDDHDERALPTPHIVARTKKHYWIATDDPAFDELVDDAYHYALGGLDAAPVGVVLAARWLIAAIGNQDALPQPEALIKRTLDHAAS